MPIIDYFETQSLDINGPLNFAAAVTPSDTADLVHLTRAVWVGTAGNLRVTLRSGNVVTFTNLAVGWHPIRVARVWATGTTASGIVGCC